MTDADRIILPDRPDALAEALRVIEEQLRRVWLAGRESVRVVASTEVEHVGR